MEAKELRIGTTILWDGNATTVDQGLIAYLCVHDNDRAKPIPLTEEWLIKFGFKTPEGYLAGNYILGDYRVNIEDFVLWRVDGAYEGDTYLVGIKYVHQLQNLYFALTGEELVTKKGLF